MRVTKRFEILPTSFNLFSCGLVRYLCWKWVFIKDSYAGKIVDQFCNPNPSAPFCLFDYVSVKTCSLLSEMMGNPGVKSCPEPGIEPQSLTCLSYLAGYASATPGNTIYSNCIVSVVKEFSFGSIYF